MLDLSIKEPTKRYDLLSSSHKDISNVVLLARELEEYTHINDTVILWLASEKGMPVTVMFDDLKDTVWFNPDYRYRVEKNHITGDISLEWWPKSVQNDDK